MKASSKVACQGFVTVKEMVVIATHKHNLELLELRDPCGTGLSSHVGADITHRTS